MNSNGSAHESDDQKENYENEYASWPEVIDNIVTNVTGKNMEVTYDFEKLQINFPEVIASWNFSRWCQMRNKRQIPDIYKTSR